MAATKNSCFSSFLPWSGPGGVKELLKLSIPMILSEASSIVNVFIEKIILGHYVPKGRQPGTDAGIVSVGWSTISVIFYLFIGIIMYSTSFFSQYVGNQQYKKVGIIFWQTAYLCVICSIAALAFLPTLSPLFSLLEDPNDPLSSDVLQAEIRYSKFMIYGMIAFLFDEFGAAFFAGIERPVPIVIINIIELAINAVADYIYIIVFDFGYMGAAYGTIFAKASGSLIFCLTAIVMPSTRSTYRIMELSSMKPRLKILAKVGVLGLGAGMMRAVELVAWAGFLFFTQRVGIMEVTGSGYAQTVHEVVALVPYGICASLEILVAHYLGAKQPENARKALITSLKVAGSYLLLVVALYEGVPRYIISLFVSDEDFDVSVQSDLNTVLDSGANTLRILGAFCHLEMLYLFLMIFECASGDTVWPAVCCFFAALLGTITPGIILWNFNQLTTVTTTLLMIGYAVFLNIPLVIMYLTGKWKTRSLVDDENSSDLIETGTIRRDKAHVHESVTFPASKQTKDSALAPETSVPPQTESPPLSPVDDTVPIVITPPTSPLDDEVSSNRTISPPISPPADLELVQLKSLPVQQSASLVSVSSDV